MTEKMKTWETVQRADKLEALGLLASGIAHDFNNLLAGNNSPEVVRYLDRAVAVPERAVSLSRQLMTFASGGALARRVGNLESLIRATVSFAGAGSNVKTEVRVAPDLRRCNFDPDQIGQVLDKLNLVLGRVARWSILHQKTRILR